MKKQEGFVIPCLQQAGQLDRESIKNKPKLRIYHKRQKDASYLIISN